jgi:hypothetical protein
MESRIAVDNLAAFLVSDAAALNGNVESVNAGDQVMG